MSATEAGNATGTSTADDTIAMRPFTASLPMALLQAREATMRLFRPVLADHELTEQQWRVLRALAAADEPLAVGDVAQRTFLLGPSLSRIIANLESRRLLSRAAAVDDQRRSNLVLTNQGRRLVATVAPISEATYEGIEERFGVDRLDRLMAELNALHDALPHALNQEPSDPNT